MEKPSALLWVKGISKRFGMNQALDRVSFELNAGEVHALTGENGAGKSTLAKIIAGVQTADEGEIWLDGKKVNFANTREAMQAGVAIVLQEFNLIPDLSVAENIFLGNNSFFKGNVWIRRKEMIVRTLELLDLFGMRNQIDPREKISSLSVAEMQMIEILKAVSNRSKIIILDEPSAALSSTEVERLFKLVRQLQAKQVAFVIVTHRLEEIYEISNRITVFRDGKLVSASNDPKVFKEEDLVKAMVGREITDLFGKRQIKEPSARQPILQVKGLTDAKGFVRDIDLTVQPGEIVGIAGLVGSGRTELLRCIFGADRRAQGEVIMNGKGLSGKSVKEAIAAGMAFVTEDRKHEGLLLEMSILFNMNFVNAALASGPLINRNLEQHLGKDYAKKLNIKMANGHLPVKSLSGGNQQKVVLAKWLMTKPSLLILDEPTRGIDIAAKAEIYAILNQLAASGMSILMVSSELPEVLGMCERILVMREGRMVMELGREEANEETIIRYASYEEQDEKRGVS